VNLLYEIDHLDGRRTVRLAGELDVSTADAPYDMVGNSYGIVDRVSDVIDVSDQLTILSAAAGRGGASNP
jgi:hypothetical protein